MVHDFRERLAYSESEPDEPFWLEAYRLYFPTMVSHTAVRRDCLAQRLGMDRLIVLASGATISIDEKKREGTWNDVLLEYLSNDKTNAPGWIEKQLQIDYIAYAFIATRRVYLLNYLLLKRAWYLNKTLWQQAYKAVPAKNPGYTTWSTPVPINVLFAALSQAMQVKVPDITPGSDLSDIPY